MKIYKIKLNNKVYEVEVEVTNSDRAIEVPVQAAPVAAPAAPAPAPANEAPKAAAPQNISGGHKVEVPMPGAMLDVKVQVGQTINKGDVVAVLEAMKMENEIVAPVSGEVAAVGVAKGDTVNIGDLIAVIK